MIFLLNREGFIPKKYKQPDQYREIFGNWAAVYKFGSYEYHIEIQAVFHRPGTGKSIEILSQGTNYRNKLRSGITTIKDAIKELERVSGETLLL